MFAKMIETMNADRFKAGMESNPAALFNPRNPAKLKKFISEVETKAQFHDKYRDNKVAYAQIFMVGSIVDDWVKKNPGVWQLSWNEFRTKLYTSFLDPSYVDKLEVKLEALKQKGSVEKYVEEFTALKSQLPEGLRSERSYKRVFVMGLKSAIRSPLMGKLPNDDVSLNEILNDALLQDAGVQVGWKDGSKENADRANTGRVYEDPDAMELDAVSVRKLRKQEKRC